MSLVSVSNIIVGNNPEFALAAFKFDITFQCFKALEGVFDWKIIYVGSASDPAYDQVIDSFDMTNINSGIMQFTIESNPPDFNKIPTQQIVGNTAIVISVSYEKQQFFRVGYYIRNEYDNPEINENPPQKPILNQLRRYIMAENPRISHFQIQWIKNQGNPIHDNEGLQKNIEIMGGDPFLSPNGAFQQLQNLNFGYGMFGTNGNSNFT